MGHAFSPGQPAQDVDLRNAVLADADDVADGYRVAAVVDDGEGLIGAGEVHGGG